MAVKAKQDGSVEKLKAAIRDVPDFPKPGIIFKDITPILGNSTLFKTAIDIIADRHRGKRIDKIAAIDARGFLFAGAMCDRLNAGLVPIRKKGKLPYKTFEQSYDLEYGSATLTIHQDAFRKGDRVVLVDDLLATGGTAGAAAVVGIQISKTAVWNTRPAAVRTERREPSGENQTRSAAPEAGEASAISTAEFPMCRQSGWTPTADPAGAWATATASGRSAPANSADQRTPPPGLGAL